MPELEDLRSIPFNVDIAYAMGGGAPARMKSEEEDQHAYTHGL
jgi:hypothetical protein